MSSIRKSILAFIIFAALLGGVILMGFIAVLEPHEHSEHAHDSPPAGEHRHHDNDDSHEHGHDREKPG